MIRVALFTLFLFAPAACGPWSPRAVAQQPNVIPAGYRVETIPPPENIFFGVAGLGVAANGDVYAGTRFGEVWRYRAGGWTLFADGMNEIAGMRVDPQTHEILVAQKPELTRLIDEDDDGVADVYQTVSADWGFSGNYHEFAFGPVKDSRGNLYGTLNLSHGVGRRVGGGIMSIGARDRGTCYRVTPDGKYSTFAWGLRSPAGLGINPRNDEMFYTDNQGDWNASSSLHQVLEGRFYGHPCSLLYHPDYQNKNLDKITPAEYDKLRQLPVVWIPHGEMANSPGNPVFDTTRGKFGPFAGQIFVGDQTRSNIFRCVLDRVGDAYQGACIEFINHLQCGAVRLKFAPDGSLWVGQTSRGWGSVGSAPYGVERIVYDGTTVPFEMHGVRLTKSGFDIQLTKPVASDTTLNQDTCRVHNWGYLYHGQYGSPKVGERRVEAVVPTLSQDRRTLHVQVPQLETRKVYKLELPGLRSQDGEALTNQRAYYTLNRLR
jgi:hypothetical protein